VKAKTVKAENSKDAAPKSEAPAADDGMEDAPKRRRRAPARKKADTVDAAE